MLSCTTTRHARTVVTKRQVRILDSADSSRLVCDCDINGVTLLVMTINYWEIYSTHEDTHVDTSLLSTSLIPYSYYPRHKINAVIHIISQHLPFAEPPV